MSLVCSDYPIPPASDPDASMALGKTEALGAHGSLVDTCWRGPPGAEKAFV